MNRQSRNLGLTSIVLLGSSVLLYGRVPNWFEPIMGASFVLAAVFGSLAARAGSKWWLVVPMVVVLIVIASLLLGE